MSICSAHAFPVPGCRLCHTMPWEMLGVTEEEYAEKVREYLDSPEGRAAMEENRVMAEETCRRFREAFKVDPETLHKPMTI